MKRLLLSAMLLLLAGCVDVEIRTRLNPDGSGVQTWNLTSSALVAGEIKKQIESDPLLKKGKRILDQYKDGEYRTALEIPFKTVAELQDEGRKIEFQKKGLLRQTFYYREKWDEKKGRIPALTKGAGGIVPLNVSISIEMPGRIISTNAPKMTQSAATWNFSVTEFSSSRDLIVESVRWNLPIILSMVVAIFSGIAISILAVIRNKQRRPLPVCSACGASVPGGLYCNNCGAKLGTA